MNYEDCDIYGMYKINLVLVLVVEDGQGLGLVLMGVDIFIGNDVYNYLDEDFGDIKEIMLDMCIGWIVYVVLFFGGFMSIGEKLFVVLWDVLKFDMVNKCFILNVEKDCLESVFGFDKDKWFDMVDLFWIVDIYVYYGMKFYLDDLCV